MQSAIRPNDELPLFAIIEHSASGPFIIFGPNWHGRKSYGVQSRRSRPGELRPVLEMTGIYRQHVTIDLGLSARDGKSDDSRAPTLLHHPKKANHSCRCRGMRFHDRFNSILRRMFVNHGEPAPPTAAKDKNFPAQRLVAREAAHIAAQQLSVV
jgi:hypothetical protein